MSTIVDIEAREILDSRGNPTVEVDVVLADGSLGRAIVPSGASTGANEALELRDGDERYGGKGVRGAVTNVNTTIAGALRGRDATDQRGVDLAMIDLDGTDTKRSLGANAMLGVSLATAKAAANSVQLPLWRYLGGANTHRLPVPFMNILNGGAHADNTVDVQEFMIAPIGAASFSEAVRWGAEIYQTLKKVLRNKGLSTGVGDEGGFAPDLKTNEDAIEALLEAIQTTGLKPGEDVSLALDVAATELFQDDKTYAFPGEGKTYAASELVARYAAWLDRYPIISIEDGVAEDDWDGWSEITQRVGDRVQLVGDDVFVTNPLFMQRGIREGVANAMCSVVSQIAR